MPTDSLGVARARLTALGFTVAPDGVHPFGTANCCVYFQDGTFLEPLVVADRAAAEKAVAGGNVFVARGPSFKVSYGDGDISAIVLGTDDALADHSAFVSAGLSIGPVLDFERAVRDSAGNADTAAFRLAFAAPRGEKQAFLFTCQRVRVPRVDRSALQRHPNGVAGIRSVEIWARGPASVGRDVARIANSTFEDGVIQLANASMRLFYTDVHYGDVFRPVSVTFAVNNLAETRRYLSETGVDYMDGNDSLSVAPERGSGATFIFGESQ